jgi:heme-degrading monooxygenase HmoA
LILEVVKWDIKPNMENEFEMVFIEAQKFLLGAKGYKSHQLNRCLEKTNRYVLLVNWETLEDHTENFSESNEYLKYRSLIHQYYAPGAILEHYETVNENAA